MWILTLYPKAWRWWLAGIGLILLLASCSETTKDDNNEESSEAPPVIIINNPASTIPTTTNPNRPNYYVNGTVFDGPVYQAKVTALDAQSNALNAPEYTDIQGKFVIGGLNQIPAALVAENGIDLGPDAALGTGDDAPLGDTLYASYQGPTTPLTPLTTLQYYAGKDLGLGSGFTGNDARDLHIVTSNVTLLKAAGLSSAEAYKSLAFDLKEANLSGLPASWRLSDAAIARATNSTKTVAANILQAMQRLGETIRNAYTEASKLQQSPSHETLWALQVVTNTLALQIPQIKLGTTVDWVGLASPESVAVVAQKLKTEDLTKTTLFDLVEKISLATTLTPEVLELLLSLPATPKALQANAVSDSGIALTWEPVNGAESYRIYRLSSSQYQAIATVNTPNFHDQNLSSGDYFYRLSAVNKIGESPLSEPLLARTLAALPTTITTIIPSTAAPSSTLTSTTTTLPATHWHKRHPALLEAPMTSVAYGNGVFVASDANGGFWTSTEGQSWTARASGSFHALNAVRYLNNQFLAVGNSETLLTSLDGSQWTSRITGSMINRIYGVTYGAGNYLAMGLQIQNSQRIILSYLSSDSQTWTPQPSLLFSSTSITLNSVAYGRNIFVAVGNGLILASTNNARTWVASTSDTYQLNDVAFANQTFVAVGNLQNGAGQILTSLDGLTWIPRTSGIATNFQSITFGQGRFVAVGSGGIVAVSGNDGVSWNSRQFLPSPAFYGVTYGNDRFVAVSEGDRLIWSDNALEGTKADLLPENLPNSTISQLNLLKNKDFFAPAELFSTVLESQYLAGFSPASTTAYANLVVRHAQQGVTWVSSDAGNWQQRAALTNESLRGMAFGQQRFFVVGHAGTVLSSTNNGLTWSSVNLATTRTLNAIAQGNQTFIAVGEGGTLLSYTNNTWTSLATTLTQTLRQISYDASLWMALGDSGVILASTTNGANWSSHASGVTTPLYDVVRGQAQWIIVGENGAILNSQDRQNWVKQNSGTSEALYGVAFGNNTFVAVGVRGTLLTSSDGLTWIKRNSGTGQTLWRVVYDQGVFVTVGEGGTLLTSPDGLTWTAKNSGTGKALYHIGAGNGTFVGLGQSGLILQAGN